MSEGVRQEMLQSVETAAAVVAQKYRKDEDFSSRLQADPKGALEEMAGSKLPEGMKVQLHYNDDKRWVIPIPSREQVEQVRPLMREGSIPDEELHQVSGGIATVIALGIAGAVIGAATVLAIATTATVIAGAQGKLNVK